MLQFLLIFIALGAVAPALINSLSRRARTNHLEYRAVLKPEEIFTRYYQTDEIALDDFLKAWKTISSILYVDERKLRPEDHLRELRGEPEWLGSSGANDVDRLVEELETVLPAGKWKPGISVDTIDDVVRLLGQR